MIWDWKNKERVKQLEGHSNYIYKIIKISSILIASCSSDNSIKIWNFNLGTLEKSLDEHTKPVRTIDILNDNILISGGNDSIVKMWDIK